MPQPRPTPSSLESRRAQPATPHSTPHPTGPSGTCNVITATSFKPHPECACASRPARRGAQPACRPASQDPNVLHACDNETRSLRPPRPRDPPHPSHPARARAVPRAHCAVREPHDRPPRAVVEPCVEEVRELGGCERRPGDERALGVPSPSRPQPCYLSTASDASRASRRQQRYLMAQTQHSPHQSSLARRQPTPQRPPHTTPRACRPAGRRGSHYRYSRRR